MNRHGTAMRLVLAGAALFVAVAPASAQHIFDGNILWGNNGGGDQCHTDAALCFDGCDLVNQYAHNDVINPMLTNPVVGPNLTPNWVPMPGSPAIGENDEVVLPVVHAANCDNCQNTPEHARIENVCFRGAVPPASIGSDWTAGWTYYNFDGAGRTDIDYAKPLVVKSGDVAANEVWSNTNNYLMIGKVSVPSGRTLTIQPGTVIFGEKATIGFLNVDRGGKIFAIGTVSQPIIFTSDQAQGSMAPGDFGGILMNGRAVANCADCLGGQSCISEGANVEHCGTDDCDNSGELRYVRVEYAGNEVAPNNELNALTMNSLGQGTRIEYVQTFRGSDDLFEWFGGKVTCKYLVGIGGQDDGLDWQMGFRGACQFAVIMYYVQDGNERGIEADNNEFDFDASCRSNPVMANLTLVGAGINSATEGDGIRLRRGTDGQIYNSIVMNFKSQAIEISNNETCARGFYPPVDVYCGPVNNVEPTDIAGGVSIRTFPNPVVDSARFFFNLPEAGHTRLSVHDVNGRAVAQVVDENLSAGTHQAVWNVPTDGSSGTYFYRMETNGQVTSGRIVAVR